MTRIVIDPVTRVGGHLRIEAEVSGGVVTDAWCAATMFRGLELALIGRDPRDAWLLADRICGIDSGVHALASVRAVEHALGMTIPGNARLVRNLLAGAQLVTSQVAGFYERQLPDSADFAAAATADPRLASDLARSIGSGPRSSFVVLQGVRDRLAPFVGSDRLGPFGPADGGAGSGLTPAANLLLAAHRLEALEWRRDMARLSTFLGGKGPHPQTFLVGGMSLTPPWGGPVRAVVGEHPRRPSTSAPATLSARGLSAMARIIGAAVAFVDEVYLPDVRYLAGQRRDDAGTGPGIGNALAFGEFPEDDSARPKLLLPRGRVMDRDLTSLERVDASGVAETVAHGHYLDDGDGSALRHPFDGRTDPRYQGPAAPVATITGSLRYSWAKAPRYDDDPMEVGPAARMAVAIAAGRSTGAAAGQLLDGFGLRPDALLGTVGRVVARAIEAKLVVDRLDGWLGELAENLAAGDLAFTDLTSWDPGRWPDEAEGWSMGESAGGAVGHWVRIRGGRFVDYQVVDGNTWNLSPRDGRGRRGALEAALIGLPVRDPDRPVEILRAVHAFDPCSACGTH